MLAHCVRAGFACRTDANSALPTVPLSSQVYEPKRLINYLDGPSNPHFMAPLFSDRKRLDNLTHTSLCTLGKEATKKSIADTQARTKKGCGAGGTSQEERSRRVDEGVEEGLLLADGCAILQKVEAARVGTGFGPDDGAGHGPAFERRVHAEEPDLVLAMATLEKGIRAFAETDEIQSDRAGTHRCHQLVLIGDALRVDQDLVVGRGWGRRGGLGGSRECQEGASQSRHGTEDAKRHGRLSTGAGAHEGVLVTRPKSST